MQNRDTIDRVSGRDTLASGNDELMPDLKAAEKVKLYGGLVSTLVEELKMIFRFRSDVRMAVQFSPLMPHRPGQILVVRPPESLSWLSAGTYRCSADNYRKS